MLVESSIFEISQSSFSPICGCLTINFSLSPEVHLCFVRSIAGVLSSRALQGFPITAHHLCAFLLYGDKITQNKKRSFLSCDANGMASLTLSLFRSFSSIRESRSCTILLDIGASLLGFSFFFFCCCYLFKKSPHHNGSVDRQAP